MEYLAKVGFYFIKDPDFVKCVFCNLEFGKWEQGDIPLKQHKRWNSYCPFLRGFDVGNIPLDGVVPRYRNSNYDVCGLYKMEFRTHSIYLKYCPKTTSKMIPG